MRLIPRQPEVFVLAFVAAATSLALLLLSGWFIAASALAGLVGVAATFNYVIPAASIRLLAFTRIGAGYGFNYFAHERLLDQLQYLREQLFQQVLNASTEVPKEDEAQKLDQHINALANRTLAVWVPLASGVGLVIALLCMVHFYLPEWLPIAVGFGLLLCGFTVWQQRKLAPLVAAQIATQASYRAALDEQLRNASLWPLRDGCAGVAREQRAWQSAQSALRQQQDVALRGLRGLSLLSVFACFAWLPENALGSPLLLLLPLAFLAVPEWLGPLMRALVPAEQAKLAAAAIAQDISSSSQSQSSSPVPLTLGSQTTISRSEIQLDNFTWRRVCRMGRPLTGALRAGAPVILTGSSGAGKSSLMLTLAGLLTANEQGRMASAGNIHYCAQQPHVLSATLRENLRIADLDADESRLIAALEFAELGYLAAELDIWIGEKGRVLSGGERKRLGLARAWLTGAEIWLLDEPFEGLDEITANILAARLRQQATQSLVVIASHRVIDALGGHTVINLDSPSGCPLSLALQE
ncbi:ATP-binding cassette domain-containing protein [Teredinibacter turnerae]|uniref:ATP-binding cassette domain-containing protein n=1 Tax=Teredinibacter turnerae TaxID=2426 RepID=UPI00036F598E|nr:ATP-binding cassette domain-containing protein [Teredinibacter turnerae]